MVGLFYIHSGGHQYPKKIKPYIGLSRDGFHFIRPAVRTPFTGSAYKRYTEEFCSGGNIVTKDEILFICGSTVHRKVKSMTDIRPGDSKQVIYSLRRDGFGALASLGRKRAVILTRKLIYVRGGTSLYVNIESIASSSYFEAQLLDEEQNLLGTSVMKNRNSTAAIVPFENSLIAKSADTVIRFRFLLEGVRLYSFWVSYGHQMEPLTFLAL